MIVFYYDTFSVGGAETLIARMAKWFFSKKEKVYILSRFQNGDDKWIKQLLRESCTEFAVNSKFNSISILKYINEKNESNDDVIFFMMSAFPCKEFLYMLYLSRKMQKIKFVNLAITTIKEEQNCISWCYSIINKMFAPFLQYLIDNNVFIGMVDYQSIEACYNVKFKKDVCFFLPMNGADYLQPIQFDENGLFRVLTVARAEFPFKGYMLGLIKCFCDLAKKNRNIALTIVSYGRDVEKLIKEISMNDKDLKDRIVLKGPIDYNEIENEIKKASVYVGMGTTLLDAAKFGKPCIAVNTYTYNVNNTFLWSNDPSALCADNIKGVSAEKIISLLYNMSQVDYGNVCLDTYEKFNNLYKIDTVMTRIEKCIVEQDKIKYSYGYLFLVVFIFRMLGKIKRIFNL